MIETIRQGLKDHGYALSSSQLCQWFGFPRRTVYYKPTEKSPTVRKCFAQPIKQMVEGNPSFGYRTVAYLLKFNKNRVQRIFRYCVGRCVSCPLDQTADSALSSVASAPNER